MNRKKPYWEMNTEELGAATRTFDDPRYDPPVVKPSAGQRAQLRRWRKKRAAGRVRLTLSLDKPLIEQTDNYAAKHGVTFSEVVSNALRQFMRQKATSGRAG